MSPQSVADAFTDSFEQVQYTLVGHPSVSQTCKGHASSMLTDARPQTQHECQTTCADSKICEGFSWGVHEGHTTARTFLDSQLDPYSSGIPGECFLATSVPTETEPSQHGFAVCYSKTTSRILNGKRMFFFCCFV